jgi:hypothetical protein
MSQSTSNKNSISLIDEPRCIPTDLDDLQAKVNVMRELQSLRDATQSASGEELRPLFGRTLLPSVLDRAFKGEL